ncbi:MAG: FtsX-like permease family protein, partial [Angustibacter sp.]
LAEGGALVSEKSAISARGTANFQLYQYGDTGPKLLSQKIYELPAAFLNTRRQVDSQTVDYTGFIVSPETAKKLTRWQQTAAIIPPGGSPLTTEAEGTINEVLTGLSPSAEVYTERGYVSNAGLPLLLLLLTGTLVVLIGTLTATSLALSDSKADSATLAAIGAKPSTRRALAAGQAVVIGLFGVLTGIAVGLIPGIAVAFPLTQRTLLNAAGESNVLSPPVIDGPWLWLAALGLGVPLLAALVAGSSVRSRMVMTRRLGQ